MFAVLSKFVVYCFPWVDGGVVRCEVADSACYAFLVSSFLRLYKKCILVLFVLGLLLFVSLFFGVTDLGASPVDGERCNRTTSVPNCATAVVRKY